MEGRKRRHDAVLQQERRATDHKGSLGALPCLSQPLVGGLQLRQQRSTGFGVLHAIRGELESATSALEQRGTELLLERTHQLGDGLQADALLARRGRKTAGLRGRQKILKGLEFVHLARSVA